MEWVLKSPQTHSTFSHLGFMHAGVYYVNENVNAALQYILHNILTEDKYLLPYRRSISFGQNIQKDLIPLLIHAKEDTTIELLVRILANLSTPVECLLSVEITSQPDVAIHTVFEINNLLKSTKAAFTGHRVTKVVLEFLKKNVDLDQQKVTPEQSTNIWSGLLLLRNVLHEPEQVKSPYPDNTGHAVRNQILWNIFSQSFDKILIKLMIIPEAANWGVTMLQLVALLYNDQHVVELQKTLNIWLETCFSESSEDNESNTSQPGRGGENSSPMSTSHPTSDSSDTGGGAKWGATSKNNTVQDQPSPPLPDKNDKMMMNDVHKADNDGPTTDENRKSDSDEKMTKSQPITTNYQQPAKTSAREYWMRIGNEELISTSSNDADVPSKKPVHQKPRNRKQRANTRARNVITLQEQKRKKIAKRGKANIFINVRGLTNETPTDDDILNMLKKFTVDFLLKGYNPLVQTLHNQILTNPQLKFDTTYFFWLVSYFLKFAIQIEVDLGQISSVISFDIVSFLTAEGVNLCEQFELEVKLNGNDLQQISRRLHLVVTSIREFVRFIDLHKKFSHICADDKKKLTTLQIRMCETNELRSLLVLLLRHYNPKYHSKQYLQDLIVTNHILLTFTDSAMRGPDYTGSTNMADHIKQFATPEIMCQYGLLLEDSKTGLEAVNDCIFTIMHHVGGQPDGLTCLSQPKILKTFSSILASDIEICDDWSDLIHCVSQTTFMENPNPNTANLRLAKQVFDDMMAEQLGVAPAKEESHPASKTDAKKSVHSSGSDFSSIKKLFYSTQINKEISDVKIEILCEQLRQDGKAECLDWIQQILLETCYAKLQVEKMYNKGLGTPTSLSDNSQIKLLSQEMDGTPVMSPVSYHALLLNRSVPLVPWNCEQASMCKDLKFLKLLHKLGFQMPIDTGKVFIRIPHVWSAEILYEVASRLGAVDPKKLKFSISDITNRTNTSMPGDATATADLAEDVTALISGPENFYQIHKQKQVAAVVDFTSRPGSSFNSDVENETNQCGWLEIVQQSKKLKLTCTAGRVHEPQRPVTEMVAAPAPAPAPDQRVRTPTEDSSLLIGQLEELEDIDSVTETASVASDLGHMYVSDEDEEVQLVPLPSTLNNQIKDEEYSSDAEPERKRPRVNAPPH